MAVTRKLECVVEDVARHGERVYTIGLHSETPFPRFRAGQFLHLALDPYAPTGFWPESRVFSIASPPAARHSLRITYAVHGAFTARMEKELVRGREVWIKLPYGDFVIESSSDVVLLAGGTGVTAFTAFLEELPRQNRPSVTLGYGARTMSLLIYRDTVERCLARVESLDVTYFVEADDAARAQPERDHVHWRSGRISVSAIWPRLRDPFASVYYISGPPPMLSGLGNDLRARNISPEAIHIDAWE